MLGHGETRGVLPYTSLVFAKTTPEIPSGFTDIENGRTPVTGNAVYKITGLAG